MALTRKGLAVSSPDTQPTRRWFPSDRTNWRDDAACVGLDSDIFFSQAVESTIVAKSICRRCPVRAACLEHALTRRERYGIWGGFTEHTRALLAARLAATGRSGAHRPGDDDGPVAA